MAKFGGGDLVELADGRQGRIHATTFNLLDGTCRYKVTNNSSTPDDVAEAEIVRIVEYGRHEYRVGGSLRGHCARCGVAKKAHR